MKRSSLTVVGTGIKFLSQMTLEARVYIEKADKVLFLVNDPALKQWICAHNKNAESLDDIYFQHTQRTEAYAAISRYILSHFTQDMHLCAAFYGHPTVFCQPALAAVHMALARGIDAKILPGISAEACLFADLGIDPGVCGCQSFEATDFLLYQRKFDENSHLILWQPDVIGMRGHAQQPELTGIQLLYERLITCYPADHDVIIYEAALFPGLKPNIQHVSLQQLPQHTLSSLCTLYIKPLGQSACDPVIAAKLQLPLKH